MREFFVNVTRYPRYLVAFGLGLLNSVVEPLADRRSNPVTAVALIGALVSGGLSLALTLRAMVTTAPVTSVWPRGAGWNGWPPRFAAR